MARKRGNIITVSGIGQAKNTMSRGAKIGLGLVMTGAAVFGGVYLLKDVKKGSMGRINNQPGTYLGDYNARIRSQYITRQLELGMQRQNEAY